MEKSYKKNKNYKISDLDFYYILDVHTLLEKIYKKGKIFEFCYERRNLKDKIEFDSFDNAYIRQGHRLYD